MKITIYKVVARDYDESDSWTFEDPHTAHNFLISSVLSGIDAHDIDISKLEEQYKGKDYFINEYIKLDDSNIDKILEDVKECDKEFEKQLTNDKPDFSKYNKMVNEILDYAYKKRGFGKPYEWDLDIEMIEIKNRNEITFFGRKVFE